MATNNLEYLSYIDKILTTYISQGALEFNFEPNKNLKITVNNNTVENNQLPLNQELIKVVVKKLISYNQNRSIDSVQEKDFHDVSGGNLEYDIYLQVNNETRLRTLNCTPIHNPLNDSLTLKMVVEPEIRVGYSEPLEVNRIDDDSKFELWFDDFCSRILNMKNPRPKDIIIHPNKSHPYITVTGGLRPLTDIIVTAGLTNRISKMLVKLSHNPQIEALLEKNNGIFDTLDIDLAYKTRTGRRFRVNIADIFDAEHEHGCLITMRLLPEKPFTIEELKIPQVIVDTVYNLKMGLVLISGTTGSGKSTTMGALIDFLLKNKSVNMLTIENPIETIFPSSIYPKSTITQREVGKHSTSQSKAMESAVRQTLNIAMVGEVRNAHDAMMAIELAQSGHLIFATLHAGSTGESIDRIVEMFPSEQSKKVRDLLSAQYKLGIAQTLIKGVHGQTELALEIFKTNNDIKAYISQNQDEERQWSMREILEFYAPAGCMSYDQCLVKLFNEGKINEDIMMFNSPDQDAFIYRQHKLGVKLSSKWDPVGSDLHDVMDNILVQRESEKLLAQEQANNKNDSSTESLLSQLESLNVKR